MELITIDKIQQGVTAGFFVFAGLIAISTSIITVGKMIETIKGWRKPQTDRTAQVGECVEAINRKLANDKLRIDRLDEESADARKMSTAMCKALNALLMHEITGNSLDRLRDAKAELDKSLISAAGGE